MSSSMKKHRPSHRSIYSHSKVRTSLNSKMNHSHNLRSLSSTKTANKTLNLKNQKISTHSTSNSKMKNQSQSPKIMCHFTTERINLPRGKVFRSSLLSSRNGSKNNSQSPPKLPHALMNSQPAFDKEKTDYFREYWKLYLQNESLISDIESQAHSNYKMLKKAYNLEDYYEHHLIPQLLTYPHKFVHRLRQQQ